MKRNYTILRMYTCFPGIITRTLPELFARFGFCRLPLLLGLLVFLLLNSIARAQYCSPANFPNADRVHLTDVIFNTISNTGTPFSANGYGNYTAMSTTISSGTTYNLTVKIVSNFGRANYLRVWCDWNRNNSFADEGEEFVIGNTAAAPGTYNFTTPIAVPATASAGSTRMRVMVKQQIDPSGDPCNSSNTAWDGEAEDYTLVLCGAAAGASISTPTGCMGASETLTVSGYGAGTIQWQRSTDGVNYTNIAGATSASITTGAVSVTTYYRVGVTSGGCTGYTLPVTKEVIVLTTTATPTSYCASGSSNLNAAYSSTTGSITNSTDYAIPDGAGNVSSPIAVSNVFPASIGASTIVSVCINITHTWLSDLKVDLIAPTGAVFVLSNGNGGGGDNYTNTCFSTTAASNINAGGNAPPYSGTYRPQGGGNFNTTFAGINPNGTWNLRVSDGTPGDAGMIRDWTITFSSGISWSPSTGLSSTTVSNPVASPASTTTYTATLYVPGKTCSPASDVTVTVNPIPGLSITSTTHVSCNGGNDGSITASASGTGPYTYNWTGSRTGATINTLTAGTYVVTVTDGNGCTRSSSVTITQPAALTSSFNVTSPVCEGENSTITYTGNGTAAGTYTWNFNGGSVVSGSGSGPYSVNWSSSGSKTVTLQVSENGCTSVLTTKTVAVDPGTAVGTISSSASTVCSGASVTLTLAGHVGSVQWQSSSDNSTWTNIAGATSSSYTTPALSSSTYFRAVVTSGTCPGANTSPVLVTVHSASVAVTVPATEAE
jgi:subtilisin-like proprotein convertase family protein